LTRAYRLAARSPGESFHSLAGLMPDGSLVSLSGSVRRVTGCLFGPAGAPLLARRLIRVARRFGSARQIARVARSTAWAFDGSFSGAIR
jgi:hypothetical protein